MEINREFIVEFTSKFESLGDEIKKVIGEISNYILSLLNKHLEILSKTSNLSIELLALLIGYKLYQIDTCGLFDREFEKNLREKLQKSGLTFPFMKPRMQITLLALNRVIQDLINARIIQSSDLWIPLTAPQLRDPIFLTRAPYPRLTFVKNLNSPEIMHHDEWMNQIASDLSSQIDKSYKDIVILGELAINKSLEWGRPKEIYRQAISTEELIPDTENGNNLLLFSSYPYYCSYEYPKIPSIKEGPSLIFTSFQILQDPINQWLAFHPSMGREFGWHFDSQGLFRWVDVENKIMVESFWWRDGLVDQFEPVYPGNVGEGWVVVATQEGWCQIVARLEKIYNTIEIAREYYKQDTGDMVTRKSSSSKRIK